MSQHRFQGGGGVAAGGGSPGSTSANGEVRVGLTDLIFENGPDAPSMAEFSQAASLRFFTQCSEYERVFVLSNNAQSVSRPDLVLSLFQLLHKFIRSCLSRTYFDGTEVQDDDLRNALAKHAESWTGDSIDPSIAPAEVCRRVTMGSEATAVDRTDAV